MSGAIERDSRHRLSAVIPVYNERDNLIPLIHELRDELRRIGSPFEIILIDDGSTDGSREILDHLAAQEPDLRILHLDGNHGQSAAFCAGFAAARGDLIITLDGDLQNDPGDISRMLEWIPRCDMVAGFRRRRHDSWLRRFSSRIANRVRSRVLADGIADTGCSLKLFRRELTENFPCFNGMHRFLPLLVQIQGGTVTQVAVNHRPRKTGLSKYNVRNRLLRGLLDLYGVWWLKRRSLRFDVSWQTESPDLAIAASRTQTEEHEP